MICVSVDSVRGVSKLPHVNAVTLQFLSSMLGCLTVPSVVSGPAGQASCGERCCPEADTCLNDHTSLTLPICCTSGHFNCGGTCCATGNSCTQDTMSGNYVCCESPRLSALMPVHAALEAASHLLSATFAAEAGFSWGRDPACVRCVGKALTDGVACQHRASRREGASVLCLLVTGLQIADHGISMSNQAAESVHDTGFMRPRRSIGRRGVRHRQLLLCRTLLHLQLPWWPN